MSKIYSVNNNSILSKTFIMNKVLGQFNVFLDIKIKIRKKEWVFLIVFRVIECFRLLLSDKFH